VLYREAGQFKTSYAADMAMFPIRQDRVALALFLVFAFVGVPLMAMFHIPPFGSDYLLRAILIPFLILSLAAIGLNILIGYCGQISLGGGAFMAIGAYSSFKFATGVYIPLAWFDTAIAIPPLPMFASIMLGGLMAALVGILFGVPSLRIKGLYLAVATLAAQFFFDWVFIRVKWFTNYTPSGSVSAPDLNFFGVLVHTPIERYILCLAFATAFAVLAKNLVRGNIGRQWMAIRDMDIAAELMGVCGVLVHHGGGRRAVGFRIPRLLGAPGLQHRPVVPTAVHGYHRRARLDSRLFPGRGIHSDPAHHAGSGAACPRHTCYGGDGLAAGARRHRRADLLPADRRAARLCQAVGNR
jgi:Branched-chain amino acid transport system / permease component